MAVPNITPISQTSRIVLTPTGSVSEVASGLSFSIPQYVNDPAFLSGAASQVNFTYKMFGGDVLDIEITNTQVYSAYEYAVLEYSSIINSHQARNVLSDVLGFPTGTFDSSGELKYGSELSSSLSGANLAVMYPDFDLRATMGVAKAASSEGGFGGVKDFYSASVDVQSGVQDYDLQARVEELGVSGSGERFEGKVQGSRITVRKVWYKTPRAMWRFYGHYGGVGTTGNLSSYGQYADDSTFEIIPVWQNKLQNTSYQDMINTRISHYSFDVKNNKLRLYPSPQFNEIRKMWFEFTLDDNDVYNLSEDGVGSKKNRGVSNFNTLPFTNIPYDSINSMGKQWCRRYALAVSKEQLGLVRSKLDSIPLPGEKVTLNGPALVEAGLTEQENLRKTLVEYLDQITYTKLAEERAALVENVDRVNQKIPKMIFVG